MSLPLQGRAALVTGSTDGLGLGIAAALSAAGCRVMLHGIVPPDAARGAVAAMPPGQAAETAYVQADFAAPAGAAAAVEATERAFGAVDILVNNAVVRHFGALETVPLADWSRSLAVNLTAPFHAMQRALPGMRARGWGRVINLASVYGQRGVPGRVDYVTTKAGILGLTRAAAAELADTAVTCNAICPGSVSTPGTEARVAALMAGGLDRRTALRRFLAGKQPSGRFVAVESVAAAALFLCGPAGADINGAILPVDGGWLAV